MSGWRLTQRYESMLGQIHWDSLGTSDADPVVLLHGTPFSSLVWREIAPALAGDHQVYVWDMPGYGQSDKSADQDLSLKALVQVFAELIDHWRLHRPAIIAHDSGGAIALGAHLRRGVPYRQLALVDAVTLRPWGSAFGQLAGDHPDTFSQLPPELHRALLKAYIDTASSPGLAPDTLDAHAAPWADAAGQAAFYRQLAQRRTDATYIDHLRPGYDNLDLPLLICAGNDDRWVPVERAHELSNIIPHAELALFTDAGHLLQEDHPAQLSTALLTFLHKGRP